MSQLHDLYYGQRMSVDMLKQKRAIVSIDRSTNTVKVLFRDGAREYSQVRRLPPDFAAFKLHVYGTLFRLISHSRRIKRIAGCDGGRIKFVASSSTRRE